MTSTSNEADPKPKRPGADAGRGGAEHLATPVERKANLLHRTIARIIDILIALAFYQVIPSVGFWFGLLYLLIADGFWNGQSVGKKLMGLRVTRYDDPGTASFKESIIRNFPIAIGFFLLPIPFIGWLFVVLVLGFEALMMMGSDSGRRIGDELAKTVTIDVTTDNSNSAKD